MNLAFFLGFGIEEDDEAALIRRENKSTRRKNRKLSERKTLPMLKPGTKRPEVTPKGPPAGLVEIRKAAPVEEKVEVRGVAIVLPEPSPKTVAPTKSMITRRDLFERGRKPRPIDGVKVVSVGPVVGLNVPPLKPDNFIEIEADGERRSVEFRDMGWLERIPTPDPPLVNNDVSANDLIETVNKSLAEEVAALPFVKTKRGRPAKQAKVAAPKAPKPVKAPKAAKVGRPEDAADELYKANRVAVLKAIVAGCYNFEQIHIHLPEMQKFTIRAALYDLREAGVIQSIKLDAGLGADEWREIFDQEKADLYIKRNGANVS